MRTTPIAVDDVYQAIGNVGINVPAGSGVLANDSDLDGTGFGATPITAFDAKGTNGGNISVTTADGSFTYDPPTGRHIRTAHVYW